MSRPSTDYFCPRCGRSRNPDTPEACCADDECAELRQLIDLATDRLRHLNGDQGAYWGTDSNNFWGASLRAALRRAGMIEHVCRWQIKGETYEG